MTYTQRNVHGTIGALNAALTLDSTDMNSAIIDLSGTWVGTVSFEGTVDGAIWKTMSAKPLDVDTANVRTATANGTWAVDSTAYEQVRARMSAYTSGAATVRIEASPGERS